MAALVPSRRIAHELAERCRGVARRHWLFAVVAGCATVLRAVVTSCALAAVPWVITSPRARTAEATPRPELAP